MVSYKEATLKGRPVILVYLDNRRVGTITEVDGGYAYTPKGGLAGETFHNVALVKRSLTARAS